MSDFLISNGPKSRGRARDLRQAAGDQSRLTTTTAQGGAAGSPEEGASIRTLPREGDIDRVLVLTRGAERVDRRPTADQLQLASEHLGLAQSAEHTLSEGARSLARIDAIAADAIAGSIVRDQVDEVRSLALGLRSADREDALRRARLLIEDRRGKPGNVLPLENARLSPEARVKLEEHRIGALPPVIELGVADVSDPSVARATRASLGDAVIRTAELLTAVRKLGDEAAGASAALTDEFSQARPAPRDRRPLRGRNAADHAARQLARITAAYPRLALASQPFVSVESALRVLD